jgi:glycerophosphoryl diester phosphodiesterase
MRTAPSSATRRSANLGVVALACCLAAACGDDVGDTHAAEAAADAATDAATDTAADSRDPADAAVDTVEVDTADASADTSTDAANDADVDRDAAEVTLDPWPPAGPRGIDCTRSAECARVQVAAHRGAHGETVPENSVASVVAAGALRLDFAEVDVRVTADGEAVVIHDATVDRTTDGSGEVEQMTLDQVRALTLLDANPDDPQTLRVPTFAEVLEAARASEVDIYLDVKTGDIDVLWDVLDETSTWDVVLVRDDLPTLISARARNADVAVLLPVDSVEAIDAGVAALTTVEAVELDPVGAPAELCEHAHSLGIRVQIDALATGDVQVLLANNTSGWEDMIEAGVDILQTEFPDRFVEFMARWVTR